MVIGNLERKCQKANQLCTAFNLSVTFLSKSKPVWQAFSSCPSMFEQLHVESVPQSPPVIKFKDGDHGKKDINKQL